VNSSPNLQTKSAPKRYWRGANLERRLIKRLNELAVFAVRSAGSKGIVDVLAVGKGAKVYFFQVKTRSISNPELDKLCSLAHKYDAIPIAALYNQKGAKGFTFLLKEGENTSLLNEEDLAKLIRGE